MTAKTAAKYEVQRATHSKSRKGGPTRGGARHVKTAISLRKDLFQQANRMSKILKVSRSRLLEAAFEEFIDRVKKQDLLDSLNKCYANAPDRDEEEVRTTMLRLAAPMLEDDPW